MRTFLKKAAILMAAATAGVTFAAAPGHAQFFWDSWGGSASRQVVSFPKSYGPGQIIVSFSDRRLYHVVGRGRAVSYPIAVPKPSARWSGTLRVSLKRTNPPWTPTASMRKEKPWLPAHVPGGHPRNPLGTHALYLGSTLYRIHGTDAPSTIGQNVSQGCIRMHNAHVAELYGRVRTGTQVTATYKSYNSYTSSFADLGISSDATTSTASVSNDDWKRRLTRGF